MPLRTPRVFNPDDYLQTPEGRVYTDERNAAAWERSYSELEALFREATQETHFFIVIGVQGSGKTTWIQRHLVSLGPSAICPRCRPACQTTSSTSSGLGSEV